MEQCPRCNTQLISCPCTISSPVESDPDDAMPEPEITADQP